MALAIGLLNAASPSHATNSGDAWTPLDIAIDATAVKGVYVDRETLDRNSTIFNVEDEKEYPYVRVLVDRVSDPTEGAAGRWGSRIDAVAIDCKGQRAHNAQIMYFKRTGAVDRYMVVGLLSFFSWEPKSTTTAPQIANALLNRLCPDTPPPNRRH